ncbi:MAG: CRISPR system precrRNA processing endoribonuclease RAMP protein Cas6 [Candidatus Njordarchaeota archaeon]
MFLKITIKIRALDSGKIRYTGGYLRAFFLNKIRSIDTTLANRLHMADRVWGASPYAITPLYKENAKEMSYIPMNIVIKKGEIYCFEIKIVEEIFIGIIEKLMESLYTESFLGNIAFKTIEIKLERPSKRDNTDIGFFDVLFRTPTYFRIKGINKHYLFPTVEKIVFSVAKFLNIFAEERIEKQYLNERIIPKIIEKNYKIRTTKPVVLGKYRKTIGFIGTITYETRSIEASQTFLELLQVAKYMNIGGNRTGGFGVLFFRAKKFKSKL